MNLNYRKISRILVLLVSSILIASVSAAVYRYMYIDGSITVGTAKLIWEAGLYATPPITYTITGSTVSIDIPVEIGTPVEIPDVLRLTNQDTVAHDLNLTVTSAISSTDFNVCNMHIYHLDTVWVLLDTLDLTTTSAPIEDLLTLNAGESYRMYFEIYPSTSATGAYSFDVEVQYE
jgi:hypothetical protein